MGRFATTDPVLISNQRLLDPQQWNLYSYARNNPLKLIDPSGREVGVLDEEALKRIRSTVPEELRSSIKLNKKGFIDKNSLNKVKTDNENYNEYKSVIQIMSDLNSAGVTDVDSDDMIPTLFLGVTDGKEETGSGVARVTLSDGTGKAAGTPAVEHAITSAHEIYGHGLLNLRGMPWMHDGPGKPVDARIKEIEDRTRRLYEAK
jgi:uncharacterized protein RhaS with RHS repeats